MRVAPTRRSGNMFSQAVVGCLACSSRDTAFSKPKARVVVGNEGARHLVSSTPADFSPFSALTGRPKI